MIDETRHCILKAFTGLLREKLYTEIRMTEIAEKAHVSRRTLYRYFDGKDQILDEALANQMTILRERSGSAKTVTCMKRCMHIMRRLSGKEMNILF